MSVIIKGMEMSTECGECPLCQYYPMVGETRCRRTGEVLASGFGTIKLSGRSEHCPLVELPEKHGRLIDADTLIAEWTDVLSTDGISPMFAMVLESAIRDVERAKVVVEVEGEE